MFWRFQLPVVNGLKATVTSTCSFDASVAGRVFDVDWMVNGPLPEIGLTVRQSVPVFLTTNCFVGGVNGQPPTKKSGKSEKKA